ncbi:CPBP family intramembrane metalloprotease [Ramlibacter sp. GTP1]|uniref:CPBP family intramembrane metalloprotease n=2 Tax=Ramlibacter albus TaxID=2079448 RepID=A0A923S0E0_9BURK|nr:CPBP family intramembrane metalloprotease [Ramlibacter albus]
MLIGFVCVVLFRDALGWLRMPSHSAPRLAADVLVRVAAAFGAYFFIVQVIEKRHAEELAWRKALPHTAAGVAAGVVLIGSVIGALWLGGAYVVTGTGSDVQWLRPLLVYGVGTAIIEEVIFRGVLFRLIDEAWGVWPALGISALFFGGVHIGNQNATLWTSFAIAVEAGVLLGVVYHVTRSLWACIGLHMVWNFLAGTVFGSPVSGMAPEASWLVAQFPGPVWLTGGAFGIEGSVLTVLLSLLLSGALLAAGAKYRLKGNTR